MRTAIQCLAFLILISQVAASTPMRIQIEKTHLGQGATGSAENPNRILIADSDVLPELYPEPLNGHLELQIDQITGQFKVNIIIIINMIVNVPTENGYKEYKIQFNILNETLKTGANSHDLLQIDHTRGVLVPTENGTMLPITSYQYLENQNASISGNVQLFFQQANQSDWNMEIIYSGYFQYNQYQKTSNSEKSNAEKAIYTIALTPLIIIYIKNKRKNW